MFRVKEISEEVGVVKLIKPTRLPARRRHTTLPFDNRELVKGDVADQGSVSDHLFRSSFFLTLKLK